MASRPTKYAHVTKNLPKFEGEAPERLQLLIGLREEILATPFDEATDWNIEAQVYRQTLRIQHEVQTLLALTKKTTQGKQTSAAFGRAYASANIVLDAISEWRSSAQLLSDAVERMMTDKMEEEGVRAVSFEDGGGVSTYQEPYGKVIDKEAFRLWCVAPAEVCMTCGNHDEYPSGYMHVANEDGTYPAGNHPFHPGGGFEKQLQLWPATMNTVAKERTLAGAPPPDGVEVMAITRVRLNKA